MALSLLFSRGGGGAALPLPPALGWLPTVIGAWVPAGWMPLAPVSAALLTAYQPYNPWAQLAPILAQ